MHVQKRELSLPSFTAKGSFGFDVIPGLLLSLVSAMSPISKIEGKDFPVTIVLLSSSWKRLHSLAMNKFNEALHFVRAEDGNSSASLDTASMVGANTTEEVY
jgi:hypothetical protein